MEDMEDIEAIIAEELGDTLPNLNDLDDALENLDDLDDNFEG